VIKVILVLISLAWLCLCATPLHAQQGIASKYPGDAGIGSDPAVIMSENFETGTVSDVLARWTNTGGQGTYSFVPSPPPGSSGTRAFSIYCPNDNSYCYLYNMLPQGYQQVYLRYYIKYLSGINPHHVGGWMGGYNPPTTYPQGGAGNRPSGSDRFTIGAEPVDSSTLRFDFYTYWMGMGCLSDPGGCWGNTFIQDPNLIAPTDRWICVEVMVNMNNPVTSSTGELAMWIEGKQITHLGPGYPNVDMIYGKWTPDPNGTGSNYIGPFPGFQWRNDPSLALNFVWFQNYGTGTILLDNIVLAKSYVGPLAVGGTTPPAPPTNLRVQ
jgi:hypothetical protein